MSAASTLSESEKLALTSTGPLFTGTGKSTPHKTEKLKKPASLLLILIPVIIIAAISFLSTSILPIQLSNKATERFDTSYAYSLKTRQIAFQEALKTGTIDSSLAARLANYGVIVGSSENGAFSATTSANTPLGVFVENQFIPASDIISAFSTNLTLFDAFEKATFGRAANFYDQTAEKVFQDIGTSRNNYNFASDLNKTLDQIVGHGSNINTNTVSLEKDPLTHKTSYKTTDHSASSAANDASNFIATIRNQNPSSDPTTATINTANFLQIADTASNTNRSAAFFVAFSENISKMKAGEGNDAKLNEAMNYLYQKSTSEIVDVNTGELKTITGAPIDSENLTALLTGSPFSIAAAKDYSSDRTITLAKNQLGNSENLNSTSQNSLKTTVASFKDKITGFISRFLSGGTELAIETVLAPLIPTISSSLFDNSASSISGISAGEFLVAGALNTYDKLSRANGATIADASSVYAYHQLNDEVLALQSAANRKNSSPLNPNSNDTFLGSLVAKLTPTLSPSSSVSIISTTSSSLASIFGATAYADNDTNPLITIDSCDRYQSINAVGNLYCSNNSVFDISTLEDPFSNPEFIAFLDANTELDQTGNRTIKNHSKLSEYVLYNVNRKSPIGVTDANILSAIQQESSVPFLSDLINMVELAQSSNEQDLRLATGEAFINSSSNPDWSTYKYAQFYVSFARSLTQFKQFSTDKTAWTHFPYFEGSENPVIAHLNQYEQTHPADTSTAGYLASITGLTKQNIISILEDFESQKSLASYNPSLAYSFISTPTNQLFFSDSSIYPLLAICPHSPSYIITKENYYVA